MSKIHVARRLPLSFEMVYWDGTDATAAFLTSWVGPTGPGGAPGFRVQRPGLIARMFGKRESVGKVYDFLHDTWITVFKGQWVVKGLTGECYPISERTLYDSYEFICCFHSPKENSR